MTLSPLLVTYAIAQFTWRAEDRFQRHICLLLSQETPWKGLLLFPSSLMIMVVYILKCGASSQLCMSIFESWLYAGFPWCRQLTVNTFFRILMAPSSGVTIFSGSTALMLLVRISILPLSVDISFQKIGISMLDDGQGGCKFQFQEMGSCLCRWQQAEWWTRWNKQFQEWLKSRSNKSFLWSSQFWSDP